MSSAGAHPPRRRSRSPTGRAMCAASAPRRGPGSRSSRTGQAGRAWDPRARGDRGTHARPAPSVAFVRELRAKHPQLLLKRAHDLDQDVLRRKVELAQAVHSRTVALRDLREPLDELSNHILGFERAALDGRDLGRGADRAGLAVDLEAERDGPLGDCVGELAPGIDELVEVLVQRLELPADDAPVQLLAEQREVDQLHKGRLQLATDLLTLVVAQRRQVCLLRDRCHLLLLLVTGLWILRQEPAPVQPARGFDAAFTASRYRPAGPARFGRPARRTPR